MTSNSRDFWVFTCIVLFIYFLISFIHILDDYEIFLNFWPFTYFNSWKLQGEWAKDEIKITELKIKDTTFELALENLFIDWIWEIIQ